MRLRPSLDAFFQVLLNQTSVVVTILSDALADKFKVKGGEESLTTTFEKIEAHSNVTVTLDLRCG